MIRYRPLESYLRKYADLVGVPLRVTCVLREGARIAGYDPINLDNLLARAVVDDATDGQGLPEIPDPYDLPVPLRCLWRSDDGLPLWAATVFHAVGEPIADVAYWHKRVQTGKWTGTKSGSYSIGSTKGRWMERRVPLPTKLCREWYADAIGDPDEIARLVKPLAFVGKRRSNGFGEVECWRVEPLESFELVREGILTRPLPAMAVSLLGAARVPEGQPSPVGWTPPEWKPRLFALGWWTGTPVGTDWYLGAISLERA